MQKKWEHAPKDHLTFDKRSSQEAKLWWLRFTQYFEMTQNIDLNSVILIDPVALYPRTQQDLQSRQILWREKRDCRRCMDENPIGRKELRFRKCNPGRTDSFQILIANWNINGRLWIENESMKEQHDHRNNYGANSQVYERPTERLK